MKGTLFVLFLMFLVPTFSKGQTIRADGKISKRENRFIRKKIYGKNSKIRLREWKDAKEARRAKAKTKKEKKKQSKQINANNRKWGKKRNGKEQARHYKAMHNDWFARDNRRKYVKETNYP